MDFGPALFWTYQVAPGNIAQKGMAIRLDDGPGGVSKETRAGVTKTLGQAETSAAPYSGYAIEP